MLNHFLLLLPMWLSAVYAAEEQNCAPCKCYVGPSYLKGKTANIADCSFTKLSELPQNLPATITQLDLTSCSLNKISGSALGRYPILDSLILDFNNFTSLDENSFPYKYHLRVLSITGNKLTELTPRTFTNVPHLTQIIGIEADLLGRGVFENLPALKDVTLYAFGDLPNGLLNSVSLQYLHLYLKTAKSIDTAVFGDSRKTLTELTIVSDVLERLPADLLQSMYSLRKFSLIVQNVTYLPENFFSQKDSPYCYLKTIFLMGLKQITKNLFCQYPDVRELNIHGSNMIVRTAFKGLENLHTLHLSYNRLKQIDPMWFHKAVHLKSLFLAFNNLRRLDVLAFSGLRMLEVLDLSHNQLFDIQWNTFLSIQNTLVGLNLSNNNISFLRPNIFMRMFSLKELDLSYNQLTILDPNMFSELYTITHIKLNGNKLGMFLKNTFKTSSLKFLNLSRNEIDRLSTGAFNTMPALKTLDLSENMLTHIPRNIVTTDSELEAVYLEQRKGVTFECDCGLVIFQTEDGKWPVVFHGHCGLPFTLRGMPISAINASEFCGDVQLKNYHSEQTRPAVDSINPSTTQPTSNKSLLPANDQQHTILKNITDGQKELSKMLLNDEPRISEGQMMMKKMSKEFNNRELYMDDNISLKLLTVLAVIVSLQ